MRKVAVERVRQRIKRFLSDQRVPVDATLVIGVSGGQDSVCLADALTSSSLDRREIVVAHVNHLMRGSQSHADAEMVRDFARERGVPFELREVDVEEFRQRLRLSREEAARILRYTALAEVCSQRGATALLTAHTSDDVAETLLLNVIRGSGPLGLSSLRPVVRIAPDSLHPGPSPLVYGPACDGVLVLRPLATTTSRSETEQYCRECGVAFVRDLTNDDTSLLRNRIRRSLLPLLTTYNPSIVERLSTLSQVTMDDVQVLDRFTDEIWPALAKTVGRNIRVDWDAWSCLEPALQRLVLRRATSQVSGQPRGPAFATIESARSLLQRRASGRRLSLGDDVWLMTARRSFTVGAGDCADDGAR